VNDRDQELTLYFTPKNCAGGKNGHAVREFRFE
jgi:hypothetical protein